MLLEFSFKNFRSFYNKAEMSLRATGKQEHKEKLIFNQGMKTKVLPSVLLYGENAAGKTSVILAALMIKDIILKTNILRTGNTMVNKLPLCSFLHDKNKYESPMEFDITFLDKNQNGQYDEIRYKCVITNKMVMENGRLETISSIYSEELYINSINIFNRVERKLSFNTEKAAIQYYYMDNENEIQNLKKLLEMQSNIFLESLSNEKVFTAWYANLNEKLVNRISTWFSDKFNILYNFNETEAHYGLSISNHIIDNIPEIITTKPDFINLFKAFVDPGPQDIILISDKKQDALDNKNIKLKLQSIYTMNKNNIKLGINSDISESNGTLKMYKFLYPFIYSLKNGTTLIIDEFDSAIHPELIVGIIKAYKDPEINVNGAQIIFNTHNPIYLNNSIFRRDEIYFVEKNKENFESELYSLVDFDIRSDENYMKNYMIGKYGALPYIDLKEPIITVLDILRKE